MAYLWCLVVVSVAVIAAPSLAAKTMQRELAELLTAMGKELGHTPALASESKANPVLPPTDPASKGERIIDNGLPPTRRQPIVSTHDDREYPIASVTKSKADPPLPEGGPTSKGQRIIDREYHSGPTPDEIIARIETGDAEDFTGNIPGRNARIETGDAEDFTGNIPGRNDEAEYKEIPNMSKEDAEEHLRKSTEGIDRMDFSWTLDKALEEMRREKGEEFYRQFRRETRQKKDGLNVYNCFFCDKDCEDTAAAYGSLTGLDSRIQQAFADIGIEAQTALVMKPGKVVPFTIYLKGYLSDRGTNDMGRVADNFWKYKNFYLRAQAAGCDSLVLSVDDKDPLYRYVPNAIGVAGMLQMCQESYTLCQVNSNAPVSASIVLHEIGHLLGMYHDTGKRESNYVNQALLNYLSDDGAALKEHCDKDDSGCSAGKGNCIMNAVSKGSSKFSQCSVAYMNAYLDLAGHFTDYYDKDCITAS